MIFNDLSTPVDQAIKNKSGGMTSITTIKTAVVFMEARARV